MGQAPHAFCLSPGSILLEAASANATVTDNSLEVFAGSVPASSADAFASITHDDLYSVPVNGSVSVLLSLTCANQGILGQASGHFSLGSTLVSPTVESIYGSFASQGSGSCGLQYQQTNPPPAYVVFLEAMNNVVRLQTHIDGVAHAADFDDRILVQLTVIGFQDANGNRIAATLLTPEPQTFAMLGLAFLLAAGIKRKHPYT